MCVDGSVMVDIGLDGHIMCHVVDISELIVEWMGWVAEKFVILAQFLLISILIFCTECIFWIL